MYAPVNWVIVGSDKDLSPKLSIHENASEKVVCVIAAILSRGSWVKMQMEELSLT